MSVAIIHMVARIELVLVVTRRSARDVSMSTGRGPDLIRNLLRAARNGRPYHPRCDTLEAIARALGVETMWLLRGQEPAVAA